MSTDQQPISHDPRYDGIYQRGGADSTQQAEVQGYQPLPQQADPVSSESPQPSIIREVGAPPEAPEVLARGRNPFDVWVWVVAAVLTVLGVYFLTAPIFAAESYAEQMMSQTGTTMYVTPWWQHTSLASLPLILLGVGTAITQLFVLSIRHTLRASSVR